MAFLNQWFLLGTAGIAIPIVIHLLNRYRPRTVDWAAMEFLRRAMAVRSRQIRLQDLILLALRCLAIILIALAMARPVIKPSGPKWLAGETYAGVVIAIDASYSMNHKAGVTSRFDKAIERTREILRTIDPGKPVTLVLMGNRTRTLFRNVGYDPQRFEQALSGAKPLSERLNLELCLEELTPLALEIKAPLRECYVVSDAQASTWGAMSDRALAEMRKITGDTRNHIYFVRASDDSNENLGITGFELASGSLYKNSVCRYVAHVRNFGQQPADNVTVKLLQDGVGVDVKTVGRIDPGQTAAVELYSQFSKAGTIRLTAALAEDALADDNTRFLTAEVRDIVRVLCMTNDPAAPATKSETVYLNTALMAKVASVPDGKGPVQVRMIGRAELSRIQFGDYDIVVFVDVPAIDSTTAGALGEFVQQGGGLMVFPGPSVDAAKFNGSMRTERMALLPAELRDVMGSDTDHAKGWAIESSGADSPISRMVALTGDRFAEGKVYRAFKLNLLPGGRPLLNLAGANSTYLAEKRIGRGKVLLFASSAGKSWSDLPLSPVYLMVIQQSLTYLTRPPQEQAYTVAAPLAVALPRQTNTPAVSFRDPAEKTASVPVAPDPESGQPMAVLPEAQAPGFYEIGYAKDAPPLMAAVNVDSVESAVASLKQDELKRAMMGTPMEVLDEGTDVMLSIQQKRIGRELWPYLMLAGLAAMMADAMLARLFSRRVHTGAATALSAPAKQRLEVSTEAA